jgi:formylglycine-generating enzyme required for sulfatase activity
MTRRMFNHKKKSNARLFAFGGITFGLLTCSVFLLGACRPADIFLRPPAEAWEAAWTNSLGMKFLHVPSKHHVLMSVWETRVKDFEAFMVTTGHDATAGFYYYDNLNWNTGTNYWRNPGFDQTPDHPVIGISWNDAVAFCHWLTEEEQKARLITTRQVYRLPTDEEWTRAAYPAMAWPYPKNTANYHVLVGIDKFDFTSPVGSFRANLNGFYDLAGNAWEYCLDRVGTHGDYRTIRGGSWQNWHPPFLGVQARGSCGVNVRIAIYGFRVVLAEVDSLAGGFPAM